MRLLWFLPFAPAARPPPPAASEAPAGDEAAEAPAEGSAEKAPEDYTGSLVVYSPHDADPLNAGVEMFRQAYPNIEVEIIAAGTGELCPARCG